MIPSSRQCSITGSMLRLIFCAAASIWTALGAGFTLEQILGSAFPYGMAAATSGGHVAWVENARGVRNIRVASPPDYQARTLSAYTADDGQELSQLTFSPDGRTLFYVRGGAANRQGEIPNPWQAARPPCSLRAPSRSSTSRSRPTAAR